MKEKKTRRWLSLLLTVVMVLSLLPAATLPVSAANADTPYRIVHLDCGRKYFSVANIERLIDTMAQYGYNQLQLAFGNGGCRFLLDDMSLSFTADGTEDGTKVEMSSESVKDNITEGNNSFNSDTRYLTQDDMNAIIRYADKKGIEIVPMLNMPGHATAIVYGTDYNSNGNLNIDNAAAREYGYALLEKYVTYFKAKGCSFFHFGADESGYTGTNMSTFLSGCASVITDAGMTPRAFNDATNVAEMPTSVQITYWHQENGSKTASELADSGYDLINTHGRWYYVIKTAQNSEIGSKYWQGKVNSAATSVELPVMKAEKMDNKWVGIDEYFDDNPGYGSTISKSLGTMFCIWCDASQDEYLTDSDVISENEEYGALYQLEKLAEHYWPDDIKKDTTAPVVKVDGGGKVPGKMTEGGTLTLTADKSVTWETSDPDVIDLLSPANDTSITGTTVTMPRLYSSSSIANGTTITGTTVTAVAKKPGTATITVTDEDRNKAQYTIEVTDAAADTAQTVTLKVGESATFDTTASTTGSYITDDNKYIAEASVAEGKKQDASVQKVDSITSGKKYLITTSYKNREYVVTNTTKTITSILSDWRGAKGLVIDGQTISADNANALKNYAWTITESGNGYTVVDENGQYLSINANSDVTLSADAEILTVESPSGKFAFAKSGSKIYLDNFGGSSHPSYNTFASAWAQTTPQDNNLWTLYEITEETTGSNVLTITGTGEGETTATIGGVEYTINVTAPTTTEEKTLSFGTSFDLPKGAVAEVTGGNEYVTVEGGKVIAGGTAGTATVIAEVKNNGGKVTARYTYTVAVSNVDLNGAEDLTVELWITNRYAGGTHNDTTYPATKAGHIVKISAANAYGENGVTLESLVPTNGVDEGNLPTLFWKGTRLDSANKQTYTGTDRSKEGREFQKVRYDGKVWQYYWNDEWTTVESGDQIIAYYMQVYNTSPEIVTAFRDYGGIAGNGGGEYDANWFAGYRGVGTAVVYPGKTMSPDGDAGIWNNTLICYYEGASGGGTPGLIKVFNSDDYRITKITITHGVHKDSTGETGADATKTWDRTTSSVVGEKTTNDAGDEWYNETTIWTADPSDTDNSTITLDDSIWGNTWKTSGIGEAFLLLFYVEPVEKEDNLKIVYWDDSNDTLINDKISVSVKEGRTFLNIKQASPVDKGEFTLDEDAKIENSVGSMEGINSRKLSLVDGIDERYKSGLYEYVSAEISADGKTLTLHYKVKNLKQYFVFDFGLPMTIDMHKVVKNADKLTGVTPIGSASAGTVDYNNENKTIVYTPNQVISEAKALSFRLTYGTGTSSTNETVSIGVVPASNVLYEDGFLSNAGGNLAAWTGDRYKTGTKAKTQTAGDSSVYGYTSAYDEETGVSGTAYTATVTADKSFTNDLSFSFKGTGFDIIGTCGPNTGTVLVRVKKGDTFVKGYLVNTALKDANLGTIYQVPLVHEQALDYDTYDVTIIGAYVDYGPSTQTMAAALSLNDGAAVNTADQIYDLMEAAGISEEEMDNVELIDMDQLYGTATMAAQSTAATDAPTDASGSMTVAIDAFRVYDESNTNQQYYADSEKNVKYVNVLDATLSGNTFKAYVEGNKAGEWTQTNYEAEGGPQNEIYLKKGQAIAFKVDTSDPIQISARAVSGTAQLVNGTSEKDLTTNTEMYYTVIAQKNVVTIKNTGDGMLALGNLKLPAGTSTQALTAADEEIVLSLLSMDPAPAFAPKLSAAARSIKVIRNKLVTVTVHASTDVARLTINGKTVSPTNGLLVKRGWSKEYIYLFTDTVKRDVSKTYEIVAYNADGTASAPVQVTG